MTEERKLELRQLLNEAMASLEIRRSGTKASLLPVEVYRQHLQRRWTSYSKDTLQILQGLQSLMDILFPLSNLDTLQILQGFKPYIINEATKSELLDFIRAEFAPFIREDKILSASSLIFGGPNDGYPLDDLLEQLLKIAIAQGIEGAVSTFDRCTEDRHGSFQYMALLEGIGLEAEIQVLEGVRLVPIPNSTSELPSYLLNFFVNPSMPSGRTLLIIDYSISPIFHKPFGPTTSQERYKQLNRTFRIEINGRILPSFIAVDSSMNILCQALSLACNSAAQTSIKWRFLAEDELFNLKVGIGYGSAWSLGPFGSSAKVKETQIKEAKRLYHILVNLDSNIREKLQIPIDRWIKSKASGNDIDKTIDLGIAFESIYLSNITEKTELSFRLRLYAAWYLGKDEEDRKMLMKEFRAIYNCRSDAVHNGKLKGEVKIGGASVSISEFIKRAQDLCRESIIKIMEDGQFPDWNDLILSGEAESDLI